jgi:hypothetical protein
MRGYKNFEARNKERGLSVQHIKQIAWYMEVTQGLSSADSPDVQGDDSLDLTSFVNKCRKGARDFDFQ